MTDGNGTGDAEALRAEIRRTRQELGETVQALAARADVKSRLRETAAHSGQRVRQRVEQAAGGVAGPVRDAGHAVQRQPVPWAVLVAGAAAVLVVVVLIRGRKR